MNATAFGEQLERLVPNRIKEMSWMRPRYPLVGVELRPDAVLATRVDRRKGAYFLAGQGRLELEDETLLPGLMNAPVGDAPKLLAAIRGALSKAGVESATKLSLALPDTMARVFLVDVKDLPASRSQADHMIRWRIKKSVPFKPEDSRIAWQPLGEFEDGRMHVLVAITPERVVRSVEELLENAGYRVGLIDLTSLNLFNALRISGQLETNAGDAPGSGDLAVLNATNTFFSVMIIRDDRMIFYRSKPYHVQGGYRGEESLRVVGRELRTSMSYYEEHLLGEGIREVLVRTVSGPVLDDIEQFAEMAKEAGCQEASVPDVRGLLPELKGLDEASLFDLMPSLGLAMRRVA